MNEKDSPEVISVAIGILLDYPFIQYDIYNKAMDYLISFVC